VAGHKNPGEVGPRPIGNRSLSLETEVKADSVHESEAAMESFDIEDEEIVDDRSKHSM
jgi:hypothetical protein